MPSLLVTHDACLDHATPAGHPERADRLRTLNALFEEPRFAALLRAQAPLGDLEAAALCHTDHYIDELRHVAPTEGMAYIDGDTAMSPGSWEAILRGVGGALAATDAVVLGHAKNAFVATRPPGHHAEANRAMGFCFFNNAAIAARHAQRKHGVGQVAIIDFDVHHGNGTQDIFWADPSVLYCSTHEMPLYPGTGAASERGDHGNIVNVPLRPGSNGATFRAAFEAGILPRLREFAPDMLVISAGFDAHTRDPLASLNLEAADFEWVTQQLLDVAENCANGRIISVLEGGYDLQGLRESAADHVSALMRA